MADLIPNRAVPVKTGINVKTPLSLLGGESYRLALYPELGSSTASVLVVSMTIQFKFEDGDKLKWTAAEKNTFAADFVNAVKSVWNNKFRITTTSTVVATPYRDVGVQFDFTTYIDGWHISEDYELSVTKIPSGDFQVSCVNYTFGNAQLDSEDLVAVSKGASMKQRGAVHEFGHMLGLRDEYPAAKANTSWTGDADSIMHSGEVVRPRHYVPFATWLTSKHETAAHLTRSRIDYKVDGRWDKSNALL